MLDHVCLTGLQAVFHSRLPGPPTHRLLHPVRHKKATKRTRDSAPGDAHVVGGYRDENGNPDCPELSMPFVPAAAFMFFFLEMSSMGIGNKTIHRRYPFLLHNQGAALTLLLCGLYMGRWYWTGRAKRYGEGGNGPLYHTCQRVRPLMTMRARSRRWSV